MRILFTQRELILRAGSEMFTVEAARALHHRGHQVAIWAQRHGELAGALQAYGVPVFRTLAEIPWPPDIIHGQHHMQTMAAMAFFRGTPLVYHCHGKPWIAKPPLHRQIRHYIAMTEGMVDEMETTHHIPRGKITVVNNAVNLQRFQRTRNAPPRIARAVVFGNNFAPGPEMDRLALLCRDKGISLDLVGLHFGNAHARPEHLLQDYDLVFAIGRCAIEAMACGCAVIPLTTGMAGGMVLPETFSQWAATNFAPRLHSPADFVNADWLSEELAKYRPEAIAAVTKRLRSEYDLEQAISTLEALYHTVLQEPAPPESAEEDFRELGLYLEGLSLDVDLSYAANVETHALSEQRARYQQIRQPLVEHQAQQALQEEQTTRQKLHDRVQKLEALVLSLQEKNSGLAARWDAATGLLRRSWLGRLFLSRIRNHLDARPPSAPAESAGTVEKG
jgi:hypothetical protein